MLSLIMKVIHEGLQWIVELFCNITFKNKYNKDLVPSSASPNECINAILFSCR